MQKAAFRQFLLYSQRWLTKKENCSQTGKFNLSQNQLSEILGSRRYCIKIWDQLTELTIKKGLIFASRLEFKKIKSQGKIMLYLSYHNVIWFSST